MMGDLGLEGGTMNESGKGMRRNRKKEGRERDLHGIGEKYGEGGST